MTRHLATPTLFLTACGVTTDPHDLSTAMTIGTGDVNCPECLALIAGGYRAVRSRVSAEAEARTRAAQARYWERRRQAGCIPPHVER